MLTGPQKAVLFLLSLEESVAAPIINELSLSEMQSLREVASSMSEISPSDIDAMYRDFVERSTEAVAVPRGGMAYLRRLALSALGPTRAREVFETSQGPMKLLEAAPPDTVAALLKHESPQLIAAIVAQIEPQAAATILTALPKEKEVEVLARLGKMNQLPADVLDQVASAIAGELPSPEADSNVNIDGISRAAEILNAAGRRQATVLLEAIEMDDPELASQFRMAMFTFEDLISVEPRSMRSLLREVPSQRLTIALKGASDAVRAAVFAGLSNRAAELIRDDMEVLGKVRKADIEAAQQEVVQIAMRLEGEGVIDLGRGEE